MEATALEYLPGGQGVHALWPAASAYVPNGQSRHATAPGKGEYLPARQLRQEDAFLAPAVFPYIPGGHKPTHAGKPSATLEEYVPGAQGWHAAASVTWPGRSPKVPFGQLEFRFIVKVEELPGHQKPRGQSPSGPLNSGSPGWSSSKTVLLPAPGSQKKLGGQAAGSELLERQ